MPARIFAVAVFGLIALSQPCQAQRAIARPIQRPVAASAAQTAPAAAASQVLRPAPAKGTPAAP